MGERKGGIIYKSFIEAVRLLDDGTQLEALNAYFDYLFEGEKYSGENPMVKAIMLMAYPSIDSANTKYENGKKGGRPKTKMKPNENQTETENNQNETKNNQNETENNQTETLIEEVEVEVEEEVEKEVKVKEKPVRHKHGEYKHVRLTEQEYTRLIEDYGEEATAKAIQKVDEYCERTGTTYKNYNLTLRKWGYEGIAKPISDARKRLLNTVWG